jgi:WD40 repeat protein
MAKDSEVEVYDAFISYRQVEPDRCWAKWLENELENYRTPRALVKARGVRRRLSKVFRDEDELAASSSLTQEVDLALRQARFLIVVCSPRSASSRWVNAEIIRFRELGRAHRILVLLIEGDPASSFPPALRELRGATPIENNWASAIGDDKPLAADLRPEGTGRTREGRRIAKLRLLAPILNCGFDDLRRREMERQRRRLALQISGFVILATAGLILWKCLQLRAARQMTELRQLHVAQQLEEQARHELLADNPLFAARDLEAGYVSLKKEPAYRLLLNTALNECKGLVRVLRGHADKIQWLDLQGTKPTVLTKSLDGAARIWDLNSGKLIHLFGKDGDKNNPVFQLELNSEGNRALFINESGSFIYDLDAGRQSNLQVTPPDGRVSAAFFTQDGKRIVGTVLNIDNGNFITKFDTWDTQNGSRVMDSSLRGSLVEIGIDSTGTNAFAVGDTNATTTSQQNFQARTLLSVETDMGHITGSLTIGAFDDLRPSPNGKRILIAHKRAFPAVYSAGTLQKLFVLLASNSVPLNAYWSPSGKLIRSPDRGGLTVWDASTGKPIRVWANLVCTAAAIDPSDSYLATVSNTGQIEVFDIHSGNLLKVFRDRIGWDQLQGFFVDDLCLRFSPDGRFLIFAGASSVAKIWDWKNCRSIPQTMGDGTVSVESAALSPNGDTVALASSGDSVIVADSGTGIPDIILHDSVHAFGEKIPSILFSPDAKTVLTGSFFGNARLWGLDGHKLLGALDFDKKAWVVGDTIHIAMHPTVPCCITLSSAGHGAVWDLTTVKQVVGFDAEKLTPFGDVEFSRDGSRFVVAGGDGWARVFDSAQGELKAKLGPPGKCLVAAEIGPFGTNALAADMDGLVNIWDLTSRKVTLSLNANGPRINEVHFKPDGTCVLAATSEGHVHLWDGETGQEVLLLSEEKLGGEPFEIGASADLTLPPGTIVRMGFLCANFSPDGNCIAAGNDSGRLSVWDTRSGKQLLKAQGHIGRITSLAFSHDGSRILTCGEDGKAKVWDISTLDENNQAAQDIIRRLTSDSE